MARRKSDEFSKEHSPRRQSSSISPALRAREERLLERRNELATLLKAVEAELAQVQTKMVETELGECRYRVVGARDLRPPLPFLEQVFNEGVQHIITHRQRDVGDTLLEPYVQGMEFDVRRSSWWLEKTTRRLLLDAASGKRILLTGDEEARPLAVLGPMTTAATDFIRCWRVARKKPTGGVIFKPSDIETLPNEESVDELLAANIRRVAKARGITLTHVPDVASVATSSFWSVLAKKHSPSLRWVEKIAKGLRVDVAELLKPFPPPQK